MGTVIDQRRGHAAEILRGVAFGLLICLTVTLGWADVGWLLFGAALAALIMYRQYWARMVAMFFSIVELAAHLQSHVLGLSLIAAFQLLVLLLPNRVIRLVWLER